MKSLIKSLELNLESVSETVMSQATTIKELQAQIAELKATNAKLSKDIAYESSMKKYYMKAYNDLH